MSTLDAIISKGRENIEKLLELAFEAGRAAERQAMKSQLMAVLTAVESPDDAAPIGNPTDSASVRVNASSRAAPGTVKPIIKKIIDHAENGISAAEIINRTGFKDNSVRGTLAALRAEGFAEQRDGYWYRLLVESLQGQHKESPDDESSEGSMSFGRR